ncbi:Ig-like domain-containing protein [Halobaculum sp. CBA1158]|uniref:Ig-like domain-containing protein n=1 Tax=Halobaculum sp. CBA1158 TaxID=2904243 RepID=UPI001F3F8FE9|nr:Ig-like domain-containing protein [Halobaculum sp. CBA1158]UIP00595.1 Ig-like domain-containing protein [Halobaculum sp. CBA1158]
MSTDRRGRPFDGLGDSLCRSPDDFGDTLRGIVADQYTCLAELRRDDRAIEGLPVRLVIALVVGVACLSVMLNMISGVQGLAVAELDVRPEPEVTTPGEQDLTLTVVDPDGRPVAGATVVVAGDTARLDGVATARTGDDGVATVTVDPTLGPNREQGTLSIDIKPPAGDRYEDRRGNTRVLVVES